MPQSTSLGPSQAKVLGYIKQFPMATVEDIALNLDFSQDNVRRILAILRLKRLIRSKNDKKGRKL